jgi:penicillin-binding protein-related factor A (putative recombinase)
VTETDINPKIIASLREVGFHANKIPDNMGMAARFSPKKPYDSFALTDTHMLAIEAKLIKPDGKTNFKSFAFNHFENQQLPELYDVNRRSCGVGVVALCVWKSRAIHRLYLLNVIEILLMIREGKTSILGKEIEQLDCYFECKKGIYQFPSNLSEILVNRKTEALNAVNEKTNGPISEVLQQLPGH